MAALRALHPDRKARGYSQKDAPCATAEIARQKPCSAVVQSRAASVPRIEPKPPSLNFAIRAVIPSQTVPDAAHGTSHSRCPWPERKPDEQRACDENGREDDLIDGCPAEFGEQLTRGE